MFRFLGCVVLTLVFFLKNSLANTPIYQKDDLRVTINGYAEGQVGDKGNEIQSRHNLYGGFAIYKKINDVMVSGALRVNSGSNAQESYGGTAIEDAYLRIGDGSTDTDDRFLSFDKESNGRLEIGITGPMTEKLRVSTTEFARATGGVSGDWFRYVKYGFDSSTTILNPQMPITNGFTSSNYADPISGTLQDYYSGSQAAKVNLYSPKYQGFLVGVGYTPSLYDRYAIIGLKNSYNYMTQDPNNNFNTKNSLSTLLHFDREITEKLQITSSIMWEHGKAARLNQNYNWSPREDLNAWMYGVVVKYENWHIGGSYSDYGKSLYLKENGTTDTMKINKDGSLSSFSNAYFYDLGIGYSTKDRGVSLTYFTSRYLDNLVTTLMLSFDRRFAITNTIMIKAYIEGGYADITHQNFFNNSNDVIANEKKAGLIFTGIRLMI